VATKSQGTSTRTRVGESRLMRGQKDSSLIRKETVWMESSTMIKMVSQYSRKTLRDNGSTRTVIDLRETLVSTRTDNHD